MLCEYFGRVRRVIFVQTAEELLTMKEQTKWHLIYRGIARWVRRQRFSVVFILECIHTAAAAEPRAGKGGGAPYLRMVWGASRTRNTL